MFEPSSQARVFGLPLGVDFPQSLVNGLLARTRPQEPEALARVELFVNTSRMQARVRQLFDGQSRFLPRIRQVSDLAKDPTLFGIPQPVSPLRRRLELRQLIVALLESQPDLGPKSAAFDMADSLADLMDEMHGEGVSPKTLHQLDVGDMSTHWARSLAFIQLIERYFEQDMQVQPDAETRQRLVIERKIAEWQKTPPQHPIIVAGSTGSRGSTAMLMHAVAKLPLGAIILPGLDYDLPHSNWSELQQADWGEDHPQYRFAALFTLLGLTSNDIPKWTEDSPNTIERNKLVSLALRPAPVTDQWQTEGRRFKDVDRATKGLSLIEARSPREEALSIAIALRQSVEEGVPIALITPDRNLTRQVTAALDRWRIEPDDSAGRPLALSAPGRFLRHVAELLCEDTSAEALLTLLKHPLTVSGGEARGDHLRWTRDLELDALRGSYAPPDAATLTGWAAKYPEEPQRGTWVNWIIDSLLNQKLNGELSLTELIGRHQKLSNVIASGPFAGGSGELWDKAAGLAALESVTNLAENAEFGGDLTSKAFSDLLRSVLNKGEVRDPRTPHPDVMFWGTLEARVQGADRVILAGLNDGIWPELPGPDPWLNRRMRQDAGLLSPERRVGLSAHDFQQAIASKEVILSRAVRDDESETVPSRWLNRLCNLLGGMSQDGADALEAMRVRGRKWVTLSEVLEEPKTTVAPAPRPSPAPPISARPDSLSVTGVTKLIRDPYAIYADKILHLKRLESVRQESDALIRGTVLHRVFERFVDETPTTDDHTVEVERLSKIASEVLNEMVPWPAMRILWLSRISRLANWFVTKELSRRSKSNHIASEVWGEVAFENHGFTLRAKADRIDRDQGGALEIYDYKTGAPPTEKMQLSYDKQLLLEAVIAKSGGFRDIPGQMVSSICYIGLTPQKEVRTDLLPADIDQVEAELLTLIDAYRDEKQGYTSRRAVHLQRFGGDYDHLARYGEWDDSLDPQTIEVGR